MTTLRFPVIVPRQSTTMPVFSFTATTRQLGEIARIQRAGRKANGKLTGFQRPQIAGHIREIRDYLEKPTAILPNAIVVAFDGSAKLKSSGAGRFELTVDISKGPPGWIVDGQQRFTALSDLGRKSFEVLVSGFICRSAEELHKQFILINNTRPLPKPLIYELLPQVGDLPQRLSSRSQAALLTEALNYREGSSLRGLIKQQTNPDGVVRDTAVQRVIMNSIADGALRLYADNDRLLLTKGFELISEYFYAVKHVFPEAWDGKTPATSRLLHGAGIVSLGYVMEFLNSATDAGDRDEFAAGLRTLKGKTAWTGGYWRFGVERRAWNSLQNTAGDVRQLSLYLVEQLKARYLARKGKPRHV